MSPAISIIIPAYRCESFLVATLASIKTQSFPDWECILIDDGSPDGTLAVANRFAVADARFRVVHQANAGVVSARNHGLTLLDPSTRFVVFMDADDVYLPDALLDLKTALEAHPDASAAHGLAEFIDENGQPLLPGQFTSLGLNRASCRGGRLQLNAEHEPTTFANVFTASTIFPPGLMLIRRVVVERVGKYDPAMAGAEDWDYIIRVCRHGDVRFVNKVVLWYRRHNANQGTGAHVRRRCHQVRHKAFFSPENSAEQRHIVRESWRAIQRDAIRIHATEAVRHLKSAKPHRAVSNLLRIPFCAYRYVKGCPTL